MSLPRLSQQMTMLAILATLSAATALVATAPSPVTHGSIRLAHFGHASHFARRGLSSPSNSGDMTFYEVGLGACELINSNSELVGALNAPDFGPAWPPRDSPACSSCVLISAPDVPSKPAIKVRIVDKCPECKPGDIDVSPTVFEHFFHKDKGRARITWHTVPCNGGAVPPQRPPAPVPAPVVPKPPQVPAPAPPQAPKPSPTTPPRVPDARPTIAPPPQRPQPQPPVAPVVPSPPAPPKVEPTRPPQDPIAQPIPTAAPLPVQPPQGGNGGKSGKGKGGNRRKCRPRNRSQSPVQNA